MANDRPPLKRTRNINDFYKKVVGDKSKINTPSTSNPNILIEDQQRPCKSQRVAPLVEDEQRPCESQRVPPLVEDEQHPCESQRVDLMVEDVQCPINPLLEDQQVPCERVVPMVEDVQCPIELLPQDQQLPCESQIVEPLIQSDRHHYESSESQRVIPLKFDDTCLEHDPGLRHQILEYDPNQQDEVRRAYINAGRNRFVMEFKWSIDKNGKRRRFQVSWFDKFHWLEYSYVKDAAFCFPCFLFRKNSAGRIGENAFTVEGYRNWKKTSGKNCGFKSHVGTPCSPHNNAVRFVDDLKIHSRHIDNRMNVITRDERQQNRLRLQTIVSCVRYLALQGQAFRGHNEKKNSANRGNFLELLNVLAETNVEIEKALEKAPKRATSTSPDIQKEMVHTLANKVRDTIIDEIGEAKFCILVDEARDESKREQMALVIRFVDKKGFVQERFFAIVGVDDTSALTLKNALCGVLARYGLNVQNIRRQGYDGASNMRGHWKGLQALFIIDCPHAYYVHCFAHRLQLALVGASKNVGHVHEFFIKLNFIVNAVGASCKRNAELHSAQEAEMAHLLDIGELETGSGLNQISSLQRPGDTRWSSHYSSVSSLIRLYGPTCVVLEKIERNGGDPAMKGNALAAIKQISTFEFVFVLHLMKELLGKTETLCQALQKKSLDILNAMHLVSCTKVVLQKMRDSGWENLLESVVLFCQKNEIDVPDMNASHKVGRRQSHVTVLHHYRCDIFMVAIDTQVDALCDRFPDNAIELLILSSALDPKEDYKSFNIDNVCKLADKFYPNDFTVEERDALRLELEIFEVDKQFNVNLQNMSTISELCQKFTETGKSEVYYLIDRLLRLVLTLPVSTATTERAFSAMKIVKTRLRNKMTDQYLADCLAVYIERQIAKSFSKDSILEHWHATGNRRVQI